MNTGQMMLTICGMVLLSTLVLNLNTNYDLVTTDIARNKFDVLAVELATTYLETIKNSERLSFDEKTITSYISDPASLSSIGRDGNETRTSYTANTYDDIDDFNGDTTHISLNSGMNNKGVIYYIRGQVEYFDASTFATTTSKKFHKKVTVKLVSNSISTDTLRLSTIISYWKFR